MSHNPYTTELRQLESRLDVAQKERARVLEACANYDAFDATPPPPFVDELAPKVPELEEQVRRAAAQLEGSVRRVARLTEQSAIGLNPFNYFDSGRRAAAAELERERNARALLWEVHQRTQRELCEVLLARAQFLQNDAQLREQHRAAVEAHGRYDRAVAQNAIDSFTAEIAQISAVLPGLQARAAAMDAELAPHMDELSAAKRESDQARRRLQRAQWYEERLDRATTGREKREIHQECEAELGDGSPSRVLSRARGTLEPSERKIAKIEERIRVVVARKSRQVDLVVIDGNNLCYSKPGVFEGVGALRAIAESGSIKAKVVIVFDASIRKRRFNEATLAHAIGGGVRVHIVNGAADETLLDLASGPNEYVISNDRFDDYRSKPAVSQRRILRYERVDGRVFIHDLGVDVRYG